jgi:hypothetical protein
MLCFIGYKVRKGDEAFPAVSLYFLTGLAAISAASENALCSARRYTPRLLSC